MSKFGDLLNDNSEEKHIEAQERKANPFASLGKAVAKASVPPAEATAAGETVNTPPVDAVSSAPFSFLGKEKKEPSENIISPLVSDATPLDEPMQGISGGDFSEQKSAKEFQAPDQPDRYNEEIVGKLKDSLDILINSIDNKDLVGDALKQIMLNLKRYPFLIDVMHPEDCNLMVRAVRESYGVTLAKKQTRSTKRATTSKEVEDVLDILGDVEISL